MSIAIVVVVTALSVLAGVPVLASAQGSTMTFVAIMSGGGETPRVASGAFGNAERLLKLSG